MAIFHFFSEQPMFNHAPNHFWLIGLGQSVFLFSPSDIAWLFQHPSRPERLQTRSAAYSASGWTCGPLLWKHPRGHCCCRTGASEETSLWAFLQVCGSYCTGQECGRSRYSWHLLKLRPMTHRLHSQPPPPPPPRSGCCSVNSSWLLPHRWG